MDKMKNLDCNQIKIFINLGIIGEEKLYIYFKSKNLKKKICNLVKPLSTTTTSKPNFYYIVYDICTCVKCFRIFYMNYFKNTRTTHTVIFLFPYFYAKSSNHTFIKKYQIVSTRIFTVIYTYCILLIILLSPIEGWRLVVHREKNMLTHRRNINQNNLCLIMIIDYWL